MFVASVALTYAAWESYVEDVAVEVTEILARSIDESAVPAEVRKSIEETKPTTWELAVHPGWRELWVRNVKSRAKGEPDSNKFGMNTARVRQIILLFEPVGLDFVGILAADDKRLLEKLVTDRGEVVHSASTPDRFNKSTAQGYRDLVERMAVAADEHLRAQAEKALGGSPWAAS